MLNSLRKDPLISFLLEKSSLTDVQLDTIMLEATEGKISVKASLRDGHQVSEGAFIRTLRQGQKKIEGCLYTILLLNYLDFVGSKDLERIIGVSILISKVKDSSPEPVAIERLLDVLEDVAQTFSRRKK